MDNQLNSPKVFLHDIKGKDIKKAASQYIQSGLKILPVNGKIPDLGKGESWTDGITDLSKFKTGIGIICGQVECLDFDNHSGNAKEILQQFIELIKPLNDKYIFTIEKTISGGFHFLYKCNKIEGSRKLAQSLLNGKPDTFIETRGENAYFVCDPSPGYELMKGSFFNIPEISPDERQILINAALSFNEYVKPEIISSGINGTDEKPGDLYNEKPEAISEAKDLLKNSGWKELNSFQWRRPDKKEGISATFGKVAPNVFYNFSANGHPFEHLKAYKPFQILSLLKFNGDFKEGAKYLIDRYKIETHPELTKAKTEPATDMQKAVEYIKSKYPNIRRNELTGEIEQAPDIDSMYVELKMNTGCKINKEGLKSFYNSTYIPNFDPIKEYFESLPNGSGCIEDLFLHLNIIGTLGEKEFYFELFKKHLIGCVAQGLGETVHRQILVLQGTKQNIGKTWFIRFLIPAILKRYATDNLDDKDEHLFLTMFWIINIDELDNFNNKDIEKIKSLVSSDVHNYRKLYSQSFARKQRRACFFGSTNKTEFLKDSENTRWINIPVDSIKYDYRNTIEINNVWGEAYHLYKSGAPFHLTNEETDFLNRLNDNFKYLSDYDHYVRDYAIQSDSNLCLTTATEFSECISYLLNIAKPNPAQMGRALQANGFQQLFIDRKRKYRIQLNFENDLKAVKEVLTTLKNRKDQYV